MNAAYTDHTAWPPRNPGESMDAYMARVCEWQAEQRRIHNPEAQAEIDRMLATMNPAPAIHPLERILSRMSASGKALIVDDGVLLEMPASRDERRAA